MQVQPPRNDAVSPFTDPDLLKNPPVPGSCDPRLYVKGPLSTPLIQENIKFKMSSIPSGEWDKVEIDREEVRVRTGFMRASVDHREMLKKLPHDLLQYFIDRERGKMMNREKFEKYFEVSKVGLPLHLKEVHSRYAKESKFLDDCIDEMMMEASRTKMNLELQVIDFNRLVNPTTKMIDHIVRVKFWINKYSITMAKLERSQTFRREEKLKQQNKIRQRMDEEEAARQEARRNNRLGAATSAGKRKRANDSVKNIVVPLKVKQRKTRSSSKKKKGIVWLSEIGARFWGVVDVANEV